MAEPTVEIFDERSIADIINARRIINGPEDKLRAASSVRYPWAPKLRTMMLDNNWTASQINFDRDKEQFKHLTEGQQLAYLRSAAFLSNLDAIQVDNLTNNVSTFITDPTVRSCIVRQTFEETVHEDAYSVMIECVVPERTLEIYDMYRSVPLLARKNQFIIDSSREVVVDPTDVNKVKSIVSNLALEGVYFFNGFNNFYAIGRATGGMQGSIANIEYIQRDELTHVDLFRRMYENVRGEEPDLFTPELVREYREIILVAAEIEGSWGRYTIEAGNPGMTDQIMTDYPRYRADIILGKMGQEPEFKIQHPCPWVDKHEKLNDKQKNFFETRNTNYTESTPEFSVKKRRR